MAFRGFARLLAASRHAVQCGGGMEVDVAVGVARRGIAWRAPSTLRWSTAILYRAHVDQIGARISSLLPRQRVGQARCAHT